MVITIIICLLHICVFYFVMSMDHLDCIGNNAIFVGLVLKRYERAYKHAITTYAEPLVQHYFDIVCIYIEFV